METKEEWLAIAEDVDKIQHLNAWVAELLLMDRKHHSDQHDKTKLGQRKKQLENMLFNVFLWEESE